MPNDDLALPPRHIPTSDLSPAGVCEGCGRDIVWTITVAGPNGRGGKAMPIDPVENLAGNVAVRPTHGSRLTARVLARGELVDRPAPGVLRDDTLRQLPGRRAPATARESGADRTAPRPPTPRRQAVRATEHELTVATDAIARRIAQRLELDFGHLSPLDQLQLREQALPFAMAALEAIPDRAEAIIRRAQEHCCTCHNADPPHEDWCPASAIQDELTA
ncbi:hypothetical protein GCM10028801_41480 [Nocardioides maradonensis]